MKREYYWSLVFFLSFVSFKANASHIVGGYFNYECINTSSPTEVVYSVEFRMYVDCINGSPQAIDPEVPISIFDQNNVLLRSNLDTLDRISSRFVPDDFSNPCIVDFPDICVEEIFYSGLVSLPRDEDLLLVYQRCCRNEIIDNILFPETQGNTFTIEVPSFDRVGCNTSPQFNRLPPKSFCAGFDLDLDLSATDADGDSLVYSICAPLNFSNQNNPRPIPAFPPPYNTVPFLAPQTATNPIPSSPQITINSSSGRLTGTPTSLGNYVIGFCVEEYRNGVLLSTTKRDLQINTGDCTPLISSVVQDQEQFCSGLTVQFKNNSTSPNAAIQGFKWDFGDTNRLDDTSRLVDPTYTYADTGVYVVTLVANPDLPCSDTSTNQFRVYPLLDPSINKDGKLCESENNIDFSVGGAFEDYATFEWDFGTQASVSFSNQDSVSNVVFSGNGPYPIQLIVNQNNCSDTLEETLEFFQNPLADFEYNPEAGCYPLTVNFENRSIIEGEADYFWSFGDGNSSTAENPTHTYTSNGYFDVFLEVITTDKCIDTVSFQVDSAVHTSLDSSRNEIDFDFSPKEGCPSLSVDFVDASFYEGGADYFWDFGDGSLSTESDPTHRYTDSGYYSIGLMLITTDKCIDTLVYTLDSAIRVLPSPTGFLTKSDDSKPKKEAVFTFDGRMSSNYINSTFLLDGKEFANTDFMEYKFQDTGRFEVSQVVENSLGCTDTASLSVFVYDVFEFIIPNIFTPNGDGVNDFFEIKHCGVYEYDITMFNRYGEEVFKSNSLNINWDGRISGKTAKSGIYYYIIQIKDFRGEYLTYKGSCTLIRD